MPQPDGAHEAADDPPAEEDAPDDRVPKREMLLRHWLLWHSGHSMGGGFDMERTSFSNAAPQSSQRYS
jgi:hypothetical protein